MYGEKMSKNKDLTLSYMQKHLQPTAFENILAKREDAFERFLPFPTMFSTLYNVSTFIF